VRTRERLDVLIRLVTAKIRCFRGEGQASVGPFLLSILLQAIRLAGQLQAIDACDVANLRYVRQDVKGFFDLLVSATREYCPSCILGSLSLSAVSSPKMMSLSGQVRAPPSSR
jgi:hypothetical protein